MPWKPFGAAAAQSTCFFKDIHGEFLKRAEGDAIFTCEDGPMIQEMMKDVLTTSQRLNKPVTILVRTPDQSGDEVVARFILTLSLKALK